MSYVRPAPDLLFPAVYRILLLYTPVTPARRLSPVCEGWDSNPGTPMGAGLKPAAFGLALLPSRGDISNGHDKSGYGFPTGLAGLLALDCDRLEYDGICRFVVPVGRGRADRLDNVHPVGDLAKDGVFVIEVWLCVECDEKL